MSSSLFMVSLELALTISFADCCFLSVPSRMLQLNG